MPVDHIRYDLLVREALRGVVQRVIADVAKNGLPGDHHFYIAFDTGAPGVRISPRLRSQYPDEMTIVLQHQFWDLAVSDVGVEVGLSFGGIPEKLFVPFDAVKGFFDPSVQFGLEFEVAGEMNVQESEGQATNSVVTASLPGLKGSEEENTSRAFPGLPAVGKKQPGGNDLFPKADQAEVPAEQTTPGEPVETAAPDDPKPEGSAQVVKLDRFRKK